MKKFAAALLLVCSLSIFAEEKSTLSAHKHKPIYMIFGNRKDNVKLQISLKYPIFKPYGSDFFLGYSQYMDWSLYSESSPFRSVDYNPEFFWRINIFNKKPKPLTNMHVDYGVYEHRSNGRAGKKNRSLDSSYARLHNDIKLWKFDIAVINKFHYTHFTAATNANINNYIGFWESGASLQLFTPFKGFIDKEEFEFKMILGNDLRKRTNIYGFKFRTMVPGFHPKFYLQIWDGYYHNILDYDKRNMAVRFGLVF